MKLYKYIFLFFISTCIFFYACKNDLTILAPYKETVSVYGVLNPNAKRQYIRINKVFLGEGNALVMAQNQDSINYPSGAITVTLERYLNGIQSPTTQGNSKLSILLKDTLVQTQSGVFNSMQRLYYTDDKLYTTGEYKLIIKNNSTDNEFTAKAVAIDSVKPSTSSPFNPPYYPYPMGTTSGYIDYSKGSIVYRIKFMSLANAKTYNVIMRFHYTDSIIGTSSVAKFIDFNFNNVKSTSVNGGEEIEVFFKGSEFYSNIAKELANVSVSNIHHRKVVKMEYIINAGTSTLADFLEVNAPSTTIAQDKPYYTNIEGGVGIFAFKSKSSISKELKNVFIDSLSSINRNTCNFKFYNSSGTWSGCQ